MSERYFKLKDGLGLDGLTGEEAPIREVGFRAAVPRMVKGNLLQDLKRVTVKPIDGTRFIKADHPAVASALVESGQYDEIEPPDDKTITAERKRLADNETRAKAAREEV